MVAQLFYVLSRIAGRYLAIPFPTPPLRGSKTYKNPTPGVPLRFTPGYKYSATPWLVARCVTCMPNDNIIADPVLSSRL